MATGLKGIRVGVRVNPNPSPNSLGNRNDANKCKWRAESSVINFFPVHPIFQNVINFCRDFVSFFRSGFRFFNFLFFPPLSTVGSSGAFGSSDPAPSAASSTPDLFSGAPPQRKLPSWGPVYPRTNFAGEKTSLPERVAGKPRKGRAGSSLSGWPQAPSGVPTVLFPFSREDLHRFPVRAQAVSPYRRKTLGAWPMGSQLAKTRSLKGGVRAVLGTWKHSGIELKVIDLGIKTHVVPGKLWRQDKKCALRMREVKQQRKAKRMIEPLAPRSAGKRLAYCANRASSCRLK